jgi:hypothetical protein
MQKLGLKCVLSTALLFMGFSAIAALDKTGLKLTPLTNPSLQAHLGEMREVQYLVVNQGDKAHTFLMQPISGVTQELGKSSYCKSQITLEPGKSCTLSLLVDVSEAVGLKNAGPVLCDLSASPQTDSSLCTQPQKEERLSVSELAVNQESLSLMIRKPISLSDHRPGKSQLRHCFAPVCDMTLFEGSDADGELHVTATALTTITATGAPSDVLVFYSNCSPYVPGGSDCIISFDSTAAAAQSATIVTISGSNTPEYTINLEVLGIGDSYNGNSLFQLPSSGNSYVFYSIDSTTTGSNSWAVFDNYCVVLRGGLALPTLAQLQTVYNNSNCTGGPIPNFTCLGAATSTRNWSSDSTSPGTHEAINFNGGGQVQIFDAPLNISEGRCVQGYQLHY